jgi:hypothetical protein
MQEFVCTYIMCCVLWYVFLCVLWSAFAGSYIEYNIMDGMSDKYPPDILWLGYVGSFEVLLGSARNSYSFLILNK